MLTTEGLRLIDIALAFAPRRMLMLTDIAIGAAANLSLIFEPGSRCGVKPCGREFWGVLGHSINYSIRAKGLNFRFFRVNLRPPLE